MHYSKEEILESREALHRYLPAGSTVYTILESVAASGMSRTMRIITFHPDGPRYLTYNVSRVLGLPLKRGKMGEDVIRVQGCGMDMGFHVVDSLRQALNMASLNHRWL